MLSSKMAFFNTIFSNLYVLSGIAICFAYVFSIRIYPVIVYLSHKKDLMAEPVERSMHQTKTPTLGGVGLFISFALGLVLMTVFADLPKPDLIKALSLLGGIIILLFLGLKDDLLMVSPKKKFSGQLLAVALVVFASDVRITSMGGIFGLLEIPYWVSIAFSIFVFLLVINAFNLIDGIDGLAGGIGLMASLFFGAYFVINNQYELGLISFVLVGSFLGFLQFNFSKRQKLFMGDTGSLFTGFLLAYLVVSFLQHAATKNQLQVFPSASVLAIAVLSYPMMDTLRVFIVRMRKGVSPFLADKNHIHHRWLALGYTHKKASLLIVMTNVLVVLLPFLMMNFNVHLQLVLCVGLGVLFYLAPFALKKTLTNIGYDTVKLKVEGNGQLLDNKAAPINKENEIAGASTPMEKEEMPYKDQADEYDALVKRYKAIHKASKRSNKFKATLGKFKKDNMVSLEKSTKIK